MRGRMVHGDRRRPDLPAVRPRGAPRHPLGVARGAEPAPARAAEAMPNVEVHFGQRCVDVDLERAAGRLRGHRHRERRPRYQRGPADRRGRRLSPRSGSRCRRPTGSSYAQSYLEHGYKELTHPAGRSGRRLPHGAERAAHLAARRLHDDRAPERRRLVHLHLLLAVHGRELVRGARDPRRRFARYFARVFPDAVPLMPTLEEDFLLNAVGSLVTVRCAPWRFKDRAALLGRRRARHRSVLRPGRQRGVRGLHRPRRVPAGVSRPTSPRRFAAYEQRRKQHADALADLAIGNFLEMRDKTASQRSSSGRRSRSCLAQLFPGRFVPLYYMVTFSRTPYADAVARARGASGARSVWRRRLTLLAVTRRPCRASLARR